MTGPGGGYGESAHDDANPTPPHGQAGQEPSRQAPWEPPGAGRPPSAYPPPRYEFPPPSPPGYPAGPPPGYGPPNYGPPGYGPPSYPAPYPGGYGFPDAAQSGTNGLAIASLIASLAGVLCCLISIVGIVLGVVALNQIKQTRQGGYGLAVAGIVVGSITLLFGLAVVFVRLAAR
jgi:hypothetical protein